MPRIPAPSKTPPSLFNHPLRTGWLEELSRWAPSMGGDGYIGVKKRGGRSHFLVGRQTGEKNKQKKNMLLCSAAVSSVWTTSQFLSSDGAVVSEARCPRCVLWEQDGQRNILAVINCRWWGKRGSENWNTKWERERARPPNDSGREYSRLEQELLAVIPQTPLHPITFRLDYLDAAACSTTHLLTILKASPSRWSLFFVYQVCNYCRATCCLLIT